MFMESDETKVDDFELALYLGLYIFFEEFSFFEADLYGFSLLCEAESDNNSVIEIFAFKFYSFFDEIAF